MREVAAAALADPKGVSILFQTGTGPGQFSSLAEAASASRSYQVSFCAMRGRERRRAIPKAERNAPTVDTDAVGPYDTLACRRLRIPGGFRLTITPESAYTHGPPIISNSTGKAVFDLSEEYRAAESVVLFLLRTLSEAERDKRPVPVSPLTPSQEAVALKGAEVVTRDIYAKAGWTFDSPPAMGTETETGTSPATVHPLAKGTPDAGDDDSDAFEI